MTTPALAVPAAPVFHAVIPARLASTRLPDKPLADIGGKPMVVRVAERARASGAQHVLVAADNPRIVEACREHGVEVMLTSHTHPSGTDRLAEVATRLAWPDDTIVVNVQGDEPLIAPQLVADVATHLSRHPECAIATAAHRIHQAAEVFNPNVVKVVLDQQQRALYFSRAPIPWARDAYQAVWPHIATMPLPEQPLYRHIGLYAYRAGFLKAYPALQASPLEAMESLEQLRALWHGERIAVLLTDTAPATGVDTADDLERVRQIWAQDMA